MSEIKEKTPTVYIQDTLRKTVEKQTDGTVTVLYDDTGIPSFMLRVPRFKVETIDSSLGRGVHPAFVVNEKEVDEIFIGQANATIIDGRAYSIPGERATRSVKFNEAREACTKKGKGWHLLSNWEYAALVMHLVKNRIRHFEKEWWDWVDGLKIVNGEIFTPGDNNFELPESEWPSMGIFFDDIDGKPQLCKEITHYSEPDPKGIEDERDDGRTCLDPISQLEHFIGAGRTPLDFTQTELEKLAQLLIFPSATPIYMETDGPIWVRNYGERLPIRGGYWSDGASAGLAALYLNTRRSYVGSYVGCRPAFINLKN
ncbi:MAG: hypothetical protein LBG42_08835 [Treponema sp.]|jgi:hypothetical protein|nr:hypothetical protein [Treponema sp.]